MSRKITLVYATGNPAKLESMRRGLASVENIVILGPGDVGRPLPYVEENGATPLENAIIKARAYYRFFGMPVFSCDSGLYFDGIPEEEQPGIHVRTVNGKRLNDDEMIEHYSAMAERYGGLTARYRNAICLVLADDEEYSAMDESLESVPFLLTSRPHPARREGFPLDSLSVDINAGKYYYDIENYMVDSSVVEIGCSRFFERVLKRYL